MIFEGRNAVHLTKRCGKLNPSLLICSAERLGTHRLDNRLIFLRRRFEHCVDVFTCPCPPADRLFRLRSSSREHYEYVTFTYQLVCITPDCTTTQAVRQKLHRVAGFRPIMKRCRYNIASYFSLANARNWALSLPKGPSPCSECWLRVLKGTEHCYFAFIKRAPRNGRGCRNGADRDPPVTVIVLFGVTCQTNFTGHRTGNI